MNFFWHKCISYFQPYTTGFLINNKLGVLVGAKKLSKFNVVCSRIHSIHMSVILWNQFRYKGIIVYLLIVDASPEKPTMYNCVKQKERLKNSHSIILLAVNTFNLWTSYCQIESRFHFFVWSIKLLVNAAFKCSLQVSCMCR